jgi:putative transposase
MMAQQEHGLSRRRTCRLIGISRSVAERAPKRERDDHARLRERLHALAGERRRFGYRRLHELLRREGFVANHKLVHRLYQEEKLALRRRGRQKRGLGGAMAGSWCPIAANQRWSLDFTEDCLANGRKFRTANLKDDCTRECPAILVDVSLPGQRVVGMLEDVARERGYPDVLVVDTSAAELLAPRAARPRPGPVGVRARGEAVLHRSRQADAERLDRELQRSLP